MDTKTTAVLAACGALLWPLLLIAYLAGDKEGGKFWFNQTLVLLIADFILGVVGGIVSRFAGIAIIGWIFGVVGGLVLGAAGVVLFICTILNIVSAAQLTERPLPLIGNIQLLK